MKFTDLKIKENHIQRFPKCPSVSMTVMEMVTVKIEIDFKPGHFLLLKILHTVPMFGRAKIVWFEIQFI